MAEYLIQGTTLTDIANAIRSKTGSTETMRPTEFANAILSIAVSEGACTFDTEDPNASLFVYQLDNFNREITIFKCISTESSVVIPDTIGGYNVIVSTEGV